MDAGGEVFLGEVCVCWGRNEGLRGDSLLREAFYLAV
jgi:hypothetical protein